LGAGTSVDIDILPVVWPCQSPLAAVAARGRQLTPAHFPPTLPLLPPDSCAYRKAGVICFVVEVRHESEARNEEPMREVAPFGTPDKSLLIQSAVCHDTCEMAAAARPRQHNFKLP